MKTILKLFLSLLVISSMGGSIVFSGQKNGSTSMQFLEISPSARANSVGDAYSVWASGAEALFWNPAGLALIQRPEFSATYTKWMFDASLGAFSCGLSLGNFGAVGMQIQYVSYGANDEAIVGGAYDNALPYAYLTGRQFTPYSYAAGLTYAKRLTNNFSTGITVKYAHESLYDKNTVAVDMPDGTTQTVNTFGDVILFDVGMRYNTGYRTLQVAAAVQNFGPTIEYATKSDKTPAPMMFRVGIAGDILGSNSLLYNTEGSRLGVAMDLFHANDVGQHIHFGMEYEYASTISLRIGYKTNYETEGFTFGAGVHQMISTIHVSFDYSYGSTTLVVGNIHRISLGVGL